MRNLTWRPCTLDTQVGSINCIIEKRTYDDFITALEYSKRTCKSIYLMEPMKINPELVESVLKFIVEGEHEWPRDGTILIFLPGLQEIQAVHEALCDSTMFGPR